VAELPERLQTSLADRYTIERELGRGGMALVFLAHDRKHDRPVALKVLRPELALSLGPERFLREIKLAAQLQHPHILPVHDSGEAAGFLFYVMPYVAGESLRERLDREQQLPVDEAVRIAREVAAALAHAHAQDVVHRDIKPENVLLSGGEAVVADFGIARAITAAGGDKLTETGLAVGTPAYMSPEQASGESRLEGRSDVYSLACVLYEMLAGHPPFSGTSVHEILARHSMDPVPSLRAARRAVPAALEVTIAKALGKEPADRFRTASEFADALGRASTAEQAAGPSLLRSRRRWVGVAAVAGVLAVAGGVFVARPPAARLDPDLVAVAPFDILAAGVPAGGLEWWGEGLIDVLSRSLDGAGLRPRAGVAVRHSRPGNVSCAAPAVGSASKASVVVATTERNFIPTSGRCAAPVRRNGHRHGWDSSQDRDAGRSGRPTASGMPARGKRRPRSACPARRSPWP
jgi:serine/threonine-protein kinase